MGKMHGILGWGVLEARENNKIQLKILRMDMLFWLLKKHSFPLSFENGRVGALTHLMITYRGSYVKVYKMGI